MLALTMDLDSSAELLGTQSQTFQLFLEEEQVQGVLKLSDGWRISIFTLALLLNTTPTILLELLEDYMLGQLIEEVENDEYYRI